MGSKSRGFMNPVASLLVVMLLALTGCSSAPSESTIKDGVISSTILQSTVGMSLTKFNITNKYEKKINDEKFYFYQYDLKYTCCGDPSKEGSMSGTIALAKRGEKWFAQNAQ